MLWRDGVAHLVKKNKNGVVQQFDSPKTVRPKRFDDSSGSTSIQLIASPKGITEPRPSTDSNFKTLRKIIII